MLASYSQNMGNAPLTWALSTVSAMGLETAVSATTDPETKRKENITTGYRFAGHVSPKGFLRPVFGDISNRFPEEIQGVYQPYFWIYRNTRLEDVRTTSTEKPKQLSLFREVADIFAEVLWPTRCCLCESPGEVLCDACKSSLRYVDVLFACKRCGSPYGIFQCTECSPFVLKSHGFDDFPLHAGAHALVLDDDSKKIITTFKDHDEFRLVDFIAQAMSRYINPAWIGSGDVALTFVPSTIDALRRRGFDHMEVIAGALSQKTGIPLIHAYKRPENIDQRKLSRQGRVQNMEGRFQVKSGSDLARSMILIDDVCTTGATLYGAAKSLRAAGAWKVYGLTFGKVMN